MSAPPDYESNAISFSQQLPSQARKGEITVSRAETHKCAYEIFNRLGRYSYVPITLATSGLYYARSLTSQGVQYQSDPCFRLRGSRIDLPASLVTLASPALVCRNAKTVHVRISFPMETTCWLVLRGPELVVGAETASDF